MVPVQHALLGSALAFGCLTIGCGDSGSDPDPDAGSQDAGEDSGADAGPDYLDPNYDEDAGPAEELPAADSQECTDALSADFTSAEDAMCWSQAVPLEEGNCGGFYCNWTEEQLLCQVEADIPCATEAELRLSCDMTLQNTVAGCARDVASSIVIDNVDEADYSKLTLACAWEALDPPVTRACLDCYVASARCAFDMCRTDCLAGDSETCDDCREDKGCTPDFFGCARSPDPQQVNPDGSAR